MKIFNGAGHLSLQSISLYLDTLLSIGSERVPSEIFEHVATCPKCRNNIVKIYNILKSAKNPYQEKLNYINNYTAVKIIPLYTTKQTTTIKRIANA